MTRWGGILILGVLWVVACRHAQDVEGEGARAEHVKKEAPAERASAKARKARKQDVERPAAQGRPMPSSSPEVLMKPEAAMRIQKRLSDAGFYSGEATGELDEKTKDALEKFQGENDLAKTGMPDDETLEALGFDPNDIWRKPTLNPARKPEDDMQKGEDARKPSRS
jgi:peptidoglycan hydrolase-like protein with peptidoglycan-binding domain